MGMKFQLKYDTIVRVSNTYHRFLFTLRRWIWFINRTLSPNGCYWSKTSNAEVDCNSLYWRDVWPQQYRLVPHTCNRGKVAKQSQLYAVATWIVAGEHCKHVSVRNPCLRGWCKNRLAGGGAPVCQWSFSRVLVCLLDVCELSKVLESVSEDIARRDP